MAKTSLPVRRCNHRWMIRCSTSPAPDLLAIGAPNFESCQTRGLNWQRPRPFPTARFLHRRHWKPLNASLYGPVLGGEGFELAPDEASKSLECRPVDVSFSRHVVLVVRPLRQKGIA